RPHHPDGGAVRAVGDAALPARAGAQRALARPAVRRDLADAPRASLHRAAARQGRGDRAGRGRRRRDLRIGMRERYGPWAVIAGASEGIGAAFATALAARGLDLVLVARRPEPLSALAGRLPVRTVVVPADLSTVDGLEQVFAASAYLEVGLVVHNAAYSPIGAFVDLDPAETARALDLNCRALLRLGHHYLPPMAERGRGGFIVRSSLAGPQG